MLTVRGLHAYYGKGHILQGVDLEIGDNEIVSILGRNGVGRSTTLKAIMGDPRPAGEVVFKGHQIAGLKPHDIARLGIGYVPEERANAPGGALSGDERQMLTICRTLMGDPGLIMVDEPTEGLSPQMVERIGELLQEIAKRGSRSCWSSSGWSSPCAFPTASM